MNRFTTLAFALGIAVTLVTTPGRVLANGDFDEALLAEFYEHLDEFQAEITDLTGELDPIVAAYRKGEDVAPRIQALIDHWEAVTVHGAIERKATITYPRVWQALIGLQQAADAGKPADQIAAAADRVDAALWQGMGAVRMVAYQVTSAPSAAAGTTTKPDEPASSAETIRHIVTALDQAVAAYGEDELTRAESLIHEAYMSRFEGLEGDLIEQDPDLVSSLERDFNATLPMLMQRGASLDEVHQQLDAMKTQLHTAGELLEEADKSRSEVF